MEPAFSYQSVEIRPEIKDLITSPPKTTDLQFFSTTAEEEIFLTFQREISPLIFKSADFSSLPPSTNFEVMPLFTEQEKETFEGGYFGNENDAKFKVNEEIFFEEV